MAWMRIARSGLRESFMADLSAKRVISNYMVRKDVILGNDFPSGKDYYSLLGNLATDSNLKPLSSCITMPELIIFGGSRGIKDTPKYQFPCAEIIIDEESDSELASENLPGLEPTESGEKPRVVVLGTGWAACRFLKGLDTNLYDVVCISPRNHMVFTPLLASTCVGTLEFRSVAEPVSRIQSALADSPNSFFYLANCTGFDTDKHQVYCETIGNVGETYCFKVAYDKLVIASGAEPSTFNIKGVKEHATFLREVAHAQEIRKKLLLNLMLSENPGCEGHHTCGLWQLVDLAFCLPNPCNELEEPLLCGY